MPSKYSTVQGVRQILVLAGSLEESKEALKFVKQNASLYSTVGVHPTRCNEFEADAEKHFAALLEVAQQGIKVGKVIAIGECGLDYDRTEFCSKEIQLRHFEQHFRLAECCSNTQMHTHIHQSTHQRLAQGQGEDLVHASF